VPWNAALAYLGYAAGKAAGEDPWGKLQEQFGRYNEIFYIVLAVVVAALIGWGLWRWRRRRGRVTEPVVETSLPEAPPGDKQSTGEPGEL
jgi:membrane protein DedA with SNARE-associated domain